MPTKTYWSTLRKATRTLHLPELVEKAVKTANWREHRVQQVFLTTPVAFDDEKVHPGQRLWLCNAIASLTRDEIIDLHDTLMATSKECLADGGDFTPPDVRARLPHIYGEPPDG